MRAFADALDCVPMALAQNSGLSPIETLASIKSRQVKEKNTRLGVDCMQTGSSGEFVLFPPTTFFPHIPVHKTLIRIVRCMASAASPASRMLFGWSTHTGLQKRSPPPRLLQSRGPNCWVTWAPLAIVIFGSPNSSLSLLIGRFALTSSQTSPLSNVG
jgi:hypothetical protein